MIAVDTRTPCGATDPETLPQPALVGFHQTHRQRIREEEKYDARLTLIKVSTAPTSQYLLGNL